MKERETILEICRKIKALADAGIEGEQHAAQNKLAEMLNNYGLTMADLQESTRTPRTFILSHRDEVSILHHVALKYGFLPNNTTQMSFSRRRICKQTDYRVVIDLTNSEYTELGEICRHYIHEHDSERSIMAKRHKTERKMLTSAFINRHNLFADQTPEGKSKPLTASERKALMQLINNMTSTDYHKPAKQLQGVA
jgi:hypothetical protein